MLNKHIILNTAALLGLLTITGLVNAQTNNGMRFNLGVELSVLNKPSIKKDIEAEGFKKNKIGMNFFLGSRFDENFGVELGYGFITKTKEFGDDGATATHKVRNMYIDALGYYPIASSVDLIGTVGVGRFKSKLASPESEDAAFINSANKAKIGLRVGFGAQYNFCSNLSGRAMLRYQKGNKNFFKSNTSVSVGGIYTF